MRPNVNDAKFLWICVTNAVNIKLHDISETGPWHFQYRIPVSGVNTKMHIYDDKCTSQPNRLRTGKMVSGQGELIYICGIITGTIVR